MTDNQERLVKRLRCLADKLENMSEQEFNCYDEIVDSYEEKLADCENYGFFDDVLGQIDEEVAILTFINTDKERGNYTVE